MNAGFHFTFRYWYVNVARRWSALLRQRSGAGLFFYPTLWAYRLFGPDQACVEFSPGLFAPLNWEDVICRDLILTGVWDPRLTGAIESLAPHCTVFLDVGANIGYFSLIASKLIQRDAQVFAFEPNPEVADLARRAFRKAALNSITLVPAAVGNQSGKAVLHINEGPNRGKTSLYQSNTNKGGSAEVETIRVDDFLNSRVIPRVDLMKIDVEGHEWSALQGAIETLKRDRPAILIELAPVLLAEAGRTVKDVMDLLDPLGYEIQRRWHPDNYLLVAKGSRAQTWLPHLGGKPGAKARAWKL